MRSYIGIAASPGARAGQAIAEFAIVSVVLMLLVFGTLDLGRGVVARQLLTNAVREASRYGSVNRADFSGMVGSAAARSPSLGLATETFSTNGGAVRCARWQASSAAWSTYASCADAQFGDRLTVCAAYQFGLTAPRLIGWSTVTMRECDQVSIQ